MGLFRADFFRSLAIGFVAGAIGLTAVMGTSSLTDTVAPPAVAAPAEAK